PTIVSAQPVRPEGEAPAPTDFKGLMGLTQFDVDMNGAVTASDVLSVINSVNQNSVHAVNPENPVDPYADVSRNGVISAEDALYVINFINQGGKDLSAAQLNAAAVDEILTSEQYWTDDNTGLTVSHVGQPGLENINFVIDAAKHAMALKAAGKQAEAEKSMDTFHALIGNRGYGVLNAMDRRTGNEDWFADPNTTPGPNAALLIAMVNINAAKYATSIQSIGSSLLGMQNASGGVRDGFRLSNYVLAEGHLDAITAFRVMAAHQPSNPVWAQAAADAENWFRNNVLDLNTGTIARSVGPDGRDDTFDTEVYVKFLSVFGAELTPTQLKLFTEKMLSQCVVQVRLSMPDGSDKTLTLADFVDPLAAETIGLRGGVVPVGVVPLTAKLANALKSVAVGLQQAQDAQGAARYKAMAELLQYQVLASLYTYPGTEHQLAPYATLGRTATANAFSWYTPRWNEKDPEGNNRIYGGSIVSGDEMVLAVLGFNPDLTVQNDPSLYNQISFVSGSMGNARDQLHALAAGRILVQPNTISSNFTGIGMLAESPVFDYSVSPTEYSRWFEPSGATVWDLSRTGSLRLRFSTDDMGKSFMIRLLPVLGDSNSDTGLIETKLTVPEGGPGGVVMDISISAALAGLTMDEMRNIRQISVHSHDSAWGHQINTDPWVLVDPWSVEGLPAGARVANPPVGQSKRGPKTARAELRALLQQALVNVAPTMKSVGRNAATKDGGKFDEYLTLINQGRNIPASEINTASELIANYAGVRPEAARALIERYNSRAAASAVSPLKLKAGHPASVIQSFIDAAIEEFTRRTGHSPADGPAIMELDDLVRASKAIPSTKTAQASQLLVSYCGLEQQAAKDVVAGYNTWVANQGARVSAAPTAEAPLTRQML
ncbi:MAG: dockerin type I domain-containing protein, partial [Candidatus Omnitrophota bacterium]